MNPLDCHYRKPTNALLHRHPGQDPFRGVARPSSGEPVQVLRRGRVVSVMVSAQDHEAMRNFYANRLQETLAQNAAGIVAQGLTEDDIRRLLDKER